MNYDSDTEKSFPKTKYKTLQLEPPPPGAASILTADDGDVEALLQAAESLHGMAAPPITPEVLEHASSLGQRAEEKQREQQAGPRC